MSFLGVVSDVLSFLLEKGDSGEILDQTQLEPATPGIYIYICTFNLFALLHFSITRWNFNFCG